MRATARRLERIVARRVRPDILHAHSPVLNAIPALWVGRRLRYSRRLRSPGLLGGRRGGSRDEPRVGPALPPHARARNLRAASGRRRDDDLRRAALGDGDARNPPQDKVTVIPNAVDIEKFTVGHACRRRAEGESGAFRRRRARASSARSTATKGWRCCWTRCRECWPRIRACDCSSWAAARRSRSEAARGRARPRGHGGVHRPRSAPRRATLLRSRRRAGVPAGCRCA